MTSEQPRGGLEDLLASAVDRQVSEQQALGQALTDIRDAVLALRDALGEEVRRAVEAQAPAPNGASAASEGVLEALDEIRSLVSGASREIQDLGGSLPAVAPDPGLADRLDRIERRLSEATALGPSGDASPGLLARIEQLEERVAALPETVAVRIGSLPAAPSGPVDVTVDTTDLERISVRLEQVLGSAGEPGPDLAEPVGELQGAVEAASRDVQALAQAMIDLNAGLREWAEDMEGRIGGLAETFVGGIGDLAQTQRTALEALGTAVSDSTGSLLGDLGELREDVEASVRSTTRPLTARLEGVEERLLEASELSRYLKDQMEDLDRVLGSLGKVPEKLEGVVAQALRRALTVRAGLVREAEKALERVLSPVGGNLEQLVSAVESMPEGLDEGGLADDVRTVSLRQVELSNRLDDLQEAFLSTLSEVEIERRRRDEVLAKAIDRAAAGRPPEAAASLSGLKKAKAPKKAAAKKATSKRKPSKQKASSEKTPKAKASKTTTTGSKKAASRSKKESEPSGLQAGGGRASRSRRSGSGSNYIPV